MFGSRVSMTLEELALFNELFTSKFGLFFPEHKREILESRLAPRLRANHVQRFNDYYLLLQYDLERELDQLVAAITNNESYFFRETGQFEALSGDTGRELINGGTLPGKLRILSAGCSAGEEPLSLNIHLRQHPLGLGETDLQIDAVDLDKERLELARAGIYRPTSLRALSPQEISRYFVQQDAESFLLRPHLRAGVRFRHGNILDVNTLRSPVAYDALFCRNVLIYFSEGALKAAIENFAKVIRPDGLLFLGHSESIIGLTKSFQAERHGQCIAYRRLS